MVVFLWASMALSYKHYPVFVHFVINTLGAFLLPMMQLVAVVAFGVGAVRSTRALVRRTEPRWGASIAAVLSWGGVVLVLWALVFLVITFTQYP